MTVPMILIDRYIFRELLKIFGISAGAFTLFLYLDKFLFMAEMVVSRGVSFLELTRLMVYLSPAYLAVTIPMSVLVASVVVFNQFSAASEWTAMKTAGWSFLRLMKPVMVFSGLAYLLATMVIFYALPWGNASYKQLLFDVLTNRSAFNLQPRVFNSDIHNFTLYVREREDPALLKGIFLADTRQPGISRIISAEEGILSPHPETHSVSLRLKNGTLHERSTRRDHYQTINFKRYDLTVKLPRRAPPASNALVSDRELSLSRLLQKIAILREQGLKPYAPAVELSKKFSIPFACLLFGIFGAPLGIQTHRSGRSGGFAVSLGILLTYYFFLISAQNLGLIGVLDPYFSVWIPNLILFIIGTGLVYKMQNDLQFQILDRVSVFCAGTLEGLRNGVGRRVPSISKRLSSGGKRHAHGQGYHDPQGHHG